MSNALAAPPILAEAEKRESEYDWLGACESYKRALGSVPEQDSSKQGEILERCGYALYRAAMQAETRDEFHEKIGLAVENYARSIQLRSKLSERGESARSLRCQAMVSYLGFWLAGDPAEKKKRLQEAWSVTKEALIEFQKAGELLEHGRAYNLLAPSAVEGYMFYSDFDSTKKTVGEAVEAGEHAIDSLSTVGNKDEIATAYVITLTQLGFFTFLLPDIDVRKKYDLKIKEYWRIANENSKEAVLLAASRPDGAAFIEDPKELLAFYEKAVECCRRTKDKLYTGKALGYLAYQMFWESLETEDPEVRVELFNRARHYGDDSEHQYSVITGDSHFGYGRWPGPPYVEFFWQLAIWETDLDKRRELLKRAMEAAPELLRRAENCGYPEYKVGSHHKVGKVFESLAKLETNPEKKRSFLEKALEHRNASIKEMPGFYRFAYWNRGVFQNHLADIKSALAELTDDTEAKRCMIMDASAAKKAGVELCLKDIQYWEESTGPNPGMRATLGGYQYEYGNLLAQLFKLTVDSTYLWKEAEAFGNAVESFEKTGLASPVAECYWRSALAYDALDQRLEAGEKFILASDNYKKSAEKIPQLKQFYQDYASYMEAWSEIEKARYHHSRQEYVLAEEDYSKAASLHKSTKQWTYLGSNYQAWSSVEKAEDLSRTEQNEGAIQAFKQASALFRDAKKSLQTELVKIESLVEREMTTELVKAADLRADYCKARIILEDAKLLNRKGDHYSSSEKYGLAAEAFEKISSALESEASRQEFKPIVALSKAWQLMTRAEAQASPGLYSEASRLFEEAKQFSPTEKATMLASGHSRFCKALEAGTRFADTRETTLYASATSHLESAANYYLRAGFQNGSEYAKATGLLFDAYAQADRAKKEEDPEKKAKLYMMTEKILQACADSYSKAQYPAKTQEVLGILDKVKQERELAVSLLEILQAPSIVSTTSSFATPTPAHERPVGLERFEHADIQANLISGRRELKIGETLDLEIEIVNAGRGPAQLVKVEEVIPEGFEISENPEPYRMEDSFLNMKGKQLNPLKTIEVKLALTPKTKGEFILRPRILYLDESGRYKSHETDPIEVTVRERATPGLPESERKLAAIMFTDMVGYTALSQKNEAIAIELLAEHRKIVRPLYSTHNGREIKTMGDAFLVEFASALEAVRCAFEIQKLFSERNAASPAERHFSVRIGIHLGDVIHSGRDVYGDAVNVASRIEPLADPGGVCVSGQVYESVKKTLSYEFESLGLREMKNVADSVMVYKIVIPWQEPYASISVHDKPITASKNAGPAPS